MTNRIRDLRADRLSLLLALTDPSAQEGLDLAAICDEQLALLIEPALNDSGAGERAKLHQIAAAADPPIRNLGDLLHHACPPIELLSWAKDLVKARAQSLVHCTPREVTSVLYYAFIAAGLATRDILISELELHDLKTGFEWCLAQKWPPENLAALLSKGGAAILLRIKTAGGVI